MDQPGTRESGEALDSVRPGFIRNVKPQRRIKPCRERSGCSCLDESACVRAIGNIFVQARSERVECRGLSTDLEIRSLDLRPLDGTDSAESKESTTGDSVDSLLIEKKGLQGWVNNTPILVSD